MIHFLIVQMCLRKQLWQVLSRLDIETITTRFSISFALEVYTGRTDQQT